MTCRPNCSYSKTFSQIDSIQDDFVRLSGYASQLSDVEPSKLCRSKTEKRIKEIHRLLMSIENEFLEIRSMFDIDDDIVSEMAVTNEDIFNLIGDYSHNKNASKEQMFTSELTDSILKILTGKGNNQKNPDLISKMIMLRHLIDYSMQKAAEEMDQIFS
jgi:hypothetical protein